MQLARILFVLAVTFAVVVICLMVKFATEFSIRDSTRTTTSADAPALRTMGLVSLREDPGDAIARFPYLVAILRNDNVSWLYACTGSLIMHRWIVTSAHCRTPGAHHVLLYHDFAKSVGRNFTRTYTVLVWKAHQDFDRPTNDIAVAKLAVRKYDVKRSFVDVKPPGGVQASIWKTVMASDQQQYLTNEVVAYDLALVPPAQCEQVFRRPLGPGALCVDLSGHDDCFADEFGPLFSDNQLVGVLALPPPSCRSRRAVFTNVSYYTSWIRAMTKDMR